MKLYGLMICMAMSVCSSAGAESLDKDVLESQYVKCMEGNFASGCLKKIFNGGFVSWFGSPGKVLDGADDFYRQWLRDGSVYKVHSVNRENKAGLFDNRAYLVERSDGVLAGFYIGFRNVKGEWLIYDLQGGDGDEFVRRLIDMPGVGVNH